ncbi:olfactory receptor 6N2-like [Micropterus dolomieu]|uniref:olfactory receptor 6N2-like n=1 Tax=Micropterus dolomieu TaxID=147949 RepID=UPI001E8DAE4D|nr:olfactory receptor 6N2-like [Micropterus dolomieu]
MTLLMDDEFNVTYITLVGYEEMGKYRYLLFFIMFIVYILTICFSFIIVCVIWIHKNLHEPMYIFIAALLVNSIACCTTLYPKLLVNFLSEKQIISYSACLLQCFLYYTFCASDFFLLSAMAYDRYVSICKPLQYPVIMTKTIVSIMLGLAWLVPACQVAVPIILSANVKLCHLTLDAIFCNNSVYSLHCVPSKERSIFDMFSLVSMALLPLLFILFTYTRILIISYRSGREVRKKAAQTCLPHLLVLICFSCLCGYDIIVIHLEVRSDIHSIMTLQAFLYYPLFNSVIYGLKMKEITKPLKKFFCRTKAI